MLPYALHPRAVGEFDAVFAWYEARNADVAASFAEDVERAILDFCEMPLAFPLWPKIDPTLGVHRYVMREFPYSIPFVVQHGQIYIVAFAHQRRRPGYWIRRVRSRVRPVSFRKKP